MANSIDELDRAFGALSDRTRRAILQRLSRGEATVSQLAAPFDMSMPAITKHLNVLEQAGLIERQRDGRMKRCSIRVEGMKPAEDWLAAQRPFLTGKPDKNSNTRRAGPAARDLNYNAS